MPSSEQYDPISIGDLDHLGISKDGKRLYWKGERIVTDFLSPAEKMVALAVAVVTIVNLGMGIFDYLRKWDMPEKSVICEITYENDSTIQNCIESPRSLSDHS